MSPLGDEESSKGQRGPAPGVPIKKPNHPDLYSYRSIVWGITLKGSLPVVLLLFLFLVVAAVVVLVLLEPPLQV